MLTIRSLNPSMLDFAAAATARVEWDTENREELSHYYAHDPAGFFMAELDGLPVGICAATSYGAYAFIGQLIVMPEVRGQGIGRALLDRAVSYLRGCGAHSIYLDGVLKAVDLYERAGFRKICRSLRFVREGGEWPAVEPGAASVQPMSKDDLPEVAALDRQLFGADRSFFLRRRLEAVPQVCKVQRSPQGKLAGYLFARQVLELVYVSAFGVLPGGDPAALLLSVAPRQAGRWIAAGVLETNTEAASLYQSFGFDLRATSPWRMVLGPDDSLGQSPELYAVGTAAKG